MPVNREIRLSIGDHDICGIRCDGQTAVFYSCDQDFTLHTTTHSAAPRLGYLDGVIHTREEAPIGEHAAGVMWVKQNGLFEGDISQIRRPEPLGQVIFMLEAESLDQYPTSAADGRLRLTLSREQFPKEMATVTALLIPADSIYALRPLYSREARIIAIESSAIPWLVLMAE